MSIEAMKQAFDALLFVGHTSRSDTAIAVCAEATDVLRQAIAQAEKQQALDKKADNARELGLDYESTHTDHPMRHWDRTCPACVEQAEKQEQFCDNHCTWRDHHSDCVRAEKQEPVAWDCCANCLRPKSQHRGEECPRPYTTVWHEWDYDFPPDNYTAPPKREWVGLTDEERHSIREWQRIQEELGTVWSPMMLYLYEAIEAALRRKNT